MKKLFGITATIVAALFLVATALCIQVLNVPQAASSFADGGLKIVIDAGHGGIDGGATGKKSGAKESDVNLAIARFLKDELEDRGFEITLTRKTDAGLYDTTAKGFKKQDMQKRKEIIQETDPDLLVSIHQNAFSSAAYRGGQVFYSKESAQGKAFANAVQEKLNLFYTEEGAKVRIEKQGDFFILKCTEKPSVLVECGFLSNAKDEELLISAVGQKKIARAIAAGVTAYLADALS